MIHRPDNKSELISAYVDGELSQDDRAHVLARAAREPAFARELAAVTRLKATLEPAVPIPQIALPKAQPRRHWRRLGRSVAAALLLLIAAGGGWLLAKQDGGGGLDARLDWAMAVHRDWAAPADRAPATAVAIPAALPLIPHVPDLTANGLDLVHADRIETPTGVPALRLGYTGSRGCRLTMIALTGTAMPPEKIIISRGGIRVGAWRAGKTGYLLLAEGMSTTRFRLVTDSVVRATRNRAPFEPETRTALQESRAGSPPCLA